VATDTSDTPKNAVVITDCGEVGTEERADEEESCTVEVPQRQEEVAEADTTPAPAEEEEEEAVVVCATYFARSRK